MQPSLTTRRETGPETDLDDLWLGEFGMQIGPKRVVRQIRVPEDGIGITQRHFLALRKPL